MRKKLHNLTTPLLALCLLLALSGLAYAATFSDINGHWAETWINKWAEKGLAAGYADGTFRPDDEVTRAEFVALTNRAFGMAKAGIEAGFTDVNPGDWYYEDVAAARAAGYISGYPDGAFRPDQTITRQEAASILARLLSLEPDAGAIARFADAGLIPAWSRASIGAVAKAGLMVGMPDGTFLPLNNLTRAEAVVSLDRAVAYRQGIPVTSAIGGIVTLDGKAAAGATVRFFKAGSYEVLKETATGSDGKFKVELKPGDYDITAATEKEVAYKSGVKVSGGQITRADLALEPAAVVSGVLKDRNGNAVKNTTVLFTTNPTFVARTDSEGKYTLPVLPGRTYTVRAYDPGKTDAEPEVVKSSLEVGPAGKHDIGALNAPFTVSAGGGGGGGGGGPSNRAPVVANSIDDRTMVVGRAVTIDLAVLFSDPDNDTLSYSASSSDSSKVTVSVSGSTLTVRAVSAGSAEVTVTASDGRGSVTYKFTVTVVTDEIPITGINIIPDIDTLVLEKGETLTLSASLSPANTTQTDVSWSITYGGGYIEMTPIGTKATIKGVNPGNAQVKVVSGDNSTISDTINIRVVEVQQISVTIDSSVSLPESAEPVKVKTTVSLGGEEISLALVLPNIGSGTTLTISETPEEAKPADLSLPFVGLDLTIGGAGGGTEVTVELPIPEGLSANDAGAFHYNSASGVWEYRAATVVNGKLVFSTTLSPVAVSRKMPSPKNLTAQVNNTVVTLTWIEVPTADSYAVFRNDVKINSYIKGATSYIDENLQAGEYTYYVKAYKEVSAGRKTIKFESAPSNSVTVKVSPVNHAPVVVNPIADRSMTVGDPVTIDLSNVFSDPDNDTLTYSVISSDTGKVAVYLSGSTLTVNPVSAGSATVTVTASDGRGGSVTDEFVVTVNAAPVTQPPVITAVSFGSAVSVIDQENKIVAVDLKEIMNQDFTNASITVSKACTLTFTLDGVGTIGEFGLKAGPNTISDVNISKFDVSAIDVSKINFTSIFNAITDSGIDRSIVFTAINYTEIFNAIKKAEIDYLGIYNAIGFQAILDELRKSDLSTKAAIFDKFNLSAVLDTIKGVADSSDKVAMYNCIDVSKIFNAVKNDQAIMARRQEVENAVAGGLQIALEKEVITIFDLLEFNESKDITPIFNKIKAADVNTQLAIYNAIDFTKLFEILLSASNDTKAAIFDAVDFTCLFDIVKGLGQDAQLAIFDAVDFGAIFNTVKNSDINLAAIYDAINFTAIFNVLQNSTIDRAAVLGAIDFVAIFDEVRSNQGISTALLELLAPLDGDGNENVLTFLATLKDDGNRSTVYTVELVLKQQ